MTKLFSLLILIFTSLAGYSQSKEVTIKGNIGVNGEKEVILYATTEGKWEKIQSAKVATDGTFSFSVPSPKEGVWSIVSNIKRAYTRPYHVKFYISGPENIDISVGEQWSDHKFNGKLSKENELYQKWIATYNEMFLKSQTYVDLYPKVADFIKISKELKAQIKYVDKNSQKLLNTIIDYDVVYGMFLFRFSPNSLHPNETEVHPFYAQTVQNEKFDNDILLKSPMTEECIRLVVMERTMKEAKRLKDEGKTSTSSIDISMNYITSNRLKAVYFMSGLGNYRTYEDFSKEYEKYGKLLWSEKQKSTIEAFVIEKKKHMRGAQAFDFTYHDMNGKMVSLSDFKGKVVLVDVWATWCGPCKEQIPHLLKLEQELHGKDIVFMGVSVDTPDKKEAWMNMVNEKGLKGIQLFAGGFSGTKICTDYKITGIPRFMIFNKEGKIYSVNAPRPSDPELKAILIELAR